VSQPRPYASQINPYANIPLLVSGPGGQTFVNRAKYAQKVYHASAQDYPLSLTALARKRTQILINGDQGGDGDTHLYYLMASSTGKFSVTMTHTALSRRLMNGPVESSLIFGNGVLPGRLLSPIFVPATTSLDIECVDLSNSSNDIRLSGIGMQLVDPMANFSGITATDRRGHYLDPMKHPYWLTFDSGAEQTLTGTSTTDSFTLTVPSVADFNCWGLLHRISANDATCEIFEGNRRRLLNQPTRLSEISSKTLSITGMPDSLVPAASMPMYWPFTHLFQRGTTINVRLTATAGTPSVALALVGELIYYPASPPGLSIPRPMGTVRR
jgi:hypothetical protein